MKISTFERAVELREKLSTIRELRNTVSQNPGLKKLLADQYKGAEELLPSDEDLEIVQAATAEFNKKWVAHLDGWIDQVRKEFEEL